MKRTYIIEVDDEGGVYLPTFEQISEDIKLMFSDQYGIESGVKVEKDEIE